MVRTTLFMAIAAGMLAGHAQATVVYTLSDQMYGGESAAQGGSLALTLAISDAAVARGKFTIDERVSFGPGPNTFTGDTGDFVSLNWAVGPSDSGVLSPTAGYYESFQASLSFANSVPSGILQLLGLTAHFSLEGNAGLFSGELDSDANNCNNAQGVSACTVSGRLAAIPEPASLALLSAGLAGLAVRRRCGFE